MKQITSLLFLFFLLHHSPVKAQDNLHQYLKDATDFIAQKNYKEAQSSLQMAIAEVNSLLGKDLLRALPVNLNGMVADSANDVNGGGMASIMGMGSGITVSREYNGADDKSATLSVMSNTAATMGITMLMNNPGMVNQSQGQSIITVNSFKGLLQWDAETKSGSLQIPTGSSIISLSTEGIQTIDEIKTLAAKLDIAAIKKVLGEQ